MEKIRQLIKRLNDAWLDSNEEYYTHIWGGAVLLIVGSVLIWILFSQTDRIDQLKRDNVALMHQLIIVDAELKSIIAQIEQQASPVVTQEQKQIDTVLQSGAQEIKGKVQEIQKELVDGSNAAKVIPQKRVYTPAYKASDLNNSMLDTFCKNNQDHSDCKEKR